jgi:hypothetical protein
MTEGWKKIPVEEAKEAVVGILHRITRWPESFTMTDLVALRRIGEQFAEEAISLRERGSRCEFLDRLGALVLEGLGVEKLPLEILREVIEPNGAIVPE